ncbi:MAG TPA: diguanylate cyclase [Rhodocyclaceae bacterium]|nr:diguanylate cyclase [Rhodocyclaceae bacterium]
MKPLRFRNRLVVRLAVLAGILVAVAAGARLTLLSSVLRDGIQELVGSHLLSVATYVAGDIDGKILARQRLLEALTRELPPTLLTEPRQLETWLAERHRLAPLFSRGLLVVRPDGQRAIADYPVIAGRRQLDFTASDWFIAVRDRRSFAVGKAGTSRLIGKGIIVMAVPMLDAKGRLLAVIAGVTALDAPGFLDLVQDNSIGGSGGYLLISPRDKIFVAASMPPMRLQPLPAPGANPLHDRAMAGFRGTGITVNAFGVEELVAIASVPTAGWFLVARMPTAEAFEPVAEIRRIVLRNGVAMSGGLALLFLVILVYTLRPMNRAAREMRRMADGDIDLQRLPVARNDEVGTMIASFNRLVDRLNEDEAALKDRGRALEQAMADLRDSEARMAHMAHHDTLTGLPNRALFDDRLNQALARAERAGRQAALLFLDVDGFKPVNDQYGHEVGDQVLQQVAQRLRESTRRADSVARIGGDEFVVLLADLDDPRAVARAVAEKCLEVIAPDFLLDRQRLKLGFSIGIAVYPDDADGAAALLARADQAMYRAKEGGRGRYAFFAEEP